MSAIEQKRDAELTINTARDLLANWEIRTGDDGAICGFVHNRSGRRWSVKEGDCSSDTIRDLERQARIQIENEEAFVKSARLQRRMLEILCQRLGEEPPEEPKDETGKQLTYLREENTKRQEEHSEALKEIVALEDRLEALDDQLEAMAGQLQTLLAQAEADWRQMIKEEYGREPGQEGPANPCPACGGKGGGEWEDGSPLVCPACDGTGAAKAKPQEPAEYIKPGPQHWKCSHCGRYEAERFMYQQCRDCGYGEPIPADDAWVELFEEIRMGDVDATLALNIWRMVLRAIREYGAKFQHDAKEGEK